jgi:hypothetical protein
VLRYVNWTAKKGSKKGQSCFGDSISKGARENRRHVSPWSDGVPVGVWTQTGVAGRTTTGILTNALVDG